MENIVIYIEIFILLVVFVFSVFLSAKSKISLVARKLSYVFLIIFFWLFFELLATLLVLPDNFSLIFWKITFSAVAIMTYLNLEFIYTLVGLKIPKKIKVFYLAILSVFVVITLFTDKIIMAINPEYKIWGKEYFVGSLFFLAGPIILLPLIQSVYINIREGLRTENKQIKKQSRFITLGITMPLVIGGITNIIFPVLNISFPKLASVGILALVFAYSYAIYTVGAFDISLGFLKIKHKISFPIIFILIILSLITGGIFYNYSSLYIKKEASQFMVALSENNSKLFQMYINSREQDVLSLADSPIVKDSFDPTLGEGVNYAQSQIKKIAQKTSQEIEEYLKANPNLTIKDLQNDQNFQRIAVQPVGETGYTAVTDYETLICRFHKNEKIIDLNLKSLSDSLPGFWSVISKSQGGKNVEGFYDWNEPDGSVEKKYMYIETVNIKTADGVGLNVAATTYLNEFGYYLNSYSEAREYMKNFNDYHGYLDMLLVKTNGETWLSAKNKILNGVNIANNKLEIPNLSKVFSDITAGQKFSFQYTLYNNPKINSAAYMGAGIYEKNKLIGVVILEFDFEKINNLLAENTHGDEETSNSNVFLIDNNKNVRAYFSRNKIVPQYIDSEDATNCLKHKYLSNEEIDKNHSRVQEFNNYLGESVIGSHEYIPETDMCILAEINEETINSSANQLLKIFGISGFAYIIIFYLLIRWIALEITRPIHKLQKDIEIIEKGDLDHKVAIDSRDEIGKLSRAFDSMTRAIKKSRKEVDKKVKEQTEEIVRKQKLLVDQQKAVLNVLEDVEEEREKTAQEKEKIDAILHSIGDGVFAVNNDMEITMFNEVAENITGYSANEAEGRTLKEIFKLVNEKDGKENMNFIKQVIRTGEPREMPKNLELVKKDGQRIAVDDSASPLRDKNGNTRGCVVVFRDVEQERAVDKAKTEFVSLASHQLRTPLTSINWYTEMIMSGDAGKVNPEQKEYLNEIYTGNQRMVALVNSLLNVSRLELGTFMIEPKLVSITGLADQEIKALKPQTQKKNIKINKKYTGKLDRYKADPKLLAMVFQNLLSNAVKYSPNDSEVNLTITRRKEDIQVTVQDHGYGIPKTQQKNIFTKLFRADNVRQMDTEGTGLGLYIIKEIVTQVGGRISFKSKEGKGTTFYVSLPPEGMKKKKGTKSLD